MFLRNQKFAKVLRKVLVAQMTVMLTLPVGALTIPTPVRAATAVSSCQTISSPGDYTLSADLVVLEESPCILITADNVTLSGVNGDGRYSITRGGEGSATNAISIGADGDPVSNVTVSDININDFTNPGADAAGIYANGSVITIQDIDITNAVHGIHIMDTSVNVTVDGVSVTNASTGVSVSQWGPGDSSSITVSDSTFTDILDNILYIQGVLGFVADGNTFLRGGTAIYLDEVNGYSITDNQITGMESSDGSIALIESSGDEENSAMVQNNTITDGFMYGILIDRVDYIDVLSNTITDIASDVEADDGGDGIHVRDSDDVLIDQNTINGADQDAIFVVGGEGTTSESIDITNNTIATTNLGDGIDIDVDTNLITISNNQLSDIGDNSFEIDGTNVTISGNTITNADGDGVDADDAHNLVITNNTFTNLSELGVDADNSNYVEVDGNTISQFGLGESAAGIVIYSGDYFRVENNTIESASEDSDGLSIDLDSPVEYSQSETLALLSGVGVDLGEGARVFSGDSPGWMDISLPIDSYTSYGSEAEIAFHFFTDGSVNYNGAAIDNVEIIADSVSIFSDDVESGVNGWSVADLSGSEQVWAIGGEGNPGNAWFSGNINNQHTVLYRTIDLSEATDVDLNFDIFLNSEGCCDYIAITIDYPGTYTTPTGIEVDEEDQVRSVWNNTFNVLDDGIRLESGAHDILLLENTIQSARWVFDDGEGNAYSAEGVGNTYRFVDGRYAADVYDIRDTDDNGYADEGEDLPFNESNLTDEYWTGYGEDEHPGTFRSASSGGRRDRLQQLYGDNWENMGEDTSSDNSSGGDTSDDSGDTSSNDSEENTSDDTVDDSSRPEPVYNDYTGRNEAPDSGKRGPSPWDASIEPISDVASGWYIRGENFDTVYYVDTNMVRHPFWDAKTFRTYAQWSDVVWVTDATLATLKFGTPMTPKPGTVLVKIEGASDVYAISSQEGTPTLHKIPTEALAIQLYGADWADYVIDIPPTMLELLVHGEDLTATSEVDKGLLKKRVELK